jgi:hypothetical protein
MNSDPKVEIIGNYGATLSLIEVTLGSLLHAFHIPFGGKILSLNQGYMLCRATLQSRHLENKNWISYSISNIAAILKSLSPAGNKLGPMLSLSMQGLLFNLGIGVFGINLAGLGLGMILLSTWSFLQPLITYYLFFGSELFKGLEYLLEKTLPYHGLSFETLLKIFFGVMILKALLAFIIAILALKYQDHNYEEKILSLAQKHVQKDRPGQKLSPLRGALRDMTRPLFVFSLFLTCVFLYFSQGSSSEMIWHLLRPLAIGFIFFYFSRTLTLDRLLEKLEARGFKNFSRASLFALDKIRKMTRRP